MPYYVNENKIPVVVPRPRGGVRALAPGAFFPDETDYYDRFCRGHFRSDVTDEVLLTRYEAPPLPKPALVHGPPAPARMRPEELVLQSVARLKQKARQLGISLEPGLPKGAIIQRLTGSDCLPDLEALHVVRRKEEPASSS